MAKLKKNLSHLVLYSEGNHLVTTSPKDWAREHQGEFPKSSFVDATNTPKTKAITKVLSLKFGFRKESNNELVVWFNFKK